LPPHLHLHRCCCCCSYGWWCLHARGLAHGYGHRGHNDGAATATGSSLTLVGLDVVELLCEQAAGQAAVAAGAEHAAHGEVAVRVADVELLREGLAVTRPPAGRDAAHKAGDDAARHAVVAASGLGDVTRGAAGAAPHVCKGREGWPHMCAWRGDTASGAWGSKVTVAVSV